jgi:hypothetical protein
VISQCTAGSGACGCAGLNANKEVIGLACTSGFCACTNNKSFQKAFTGDCTTPEQAKQLLAAQCGCQ